ncbi:hypothetical protein [Brevibacillus sp. 179-C9.3 HS]|uniref:hypothetical protein n=1 Tax=unclassified Brevibacillus TaxID=2684853 RepID=UPI0039A367A3
MKNKTTCLILWFSQSVYVLYLFAWLLTVAFTAFLLPENENDTSALPQVFYAVLIYPFALLVSAIGSWVAYHKHNFKVSYWLNSIPLLWIIPMTLLFILFIVAV